MKNFRDFRTFRRAVPELGCSRGFIKMNGFVCTPTCRVSRLVGVETPVPALVKVSAKNARFRLHADMPSFAISWGRNPNLQCFQVFAKPKGFKTKVFRLSRKILRGSSFCRNERLRLLYNARPAASDKDFAGTASFTFSKNCFDARVFPNGQR